MTPNGKTICLTMIVKNEAHVIRRCLASVRPFLDCWVIVDTGSADGTQQVIRDALADVPGSLYERPWRDFAANRTEAIRLAEDRADYLLVIDADEVLLTGSDFAMPALTADAYELKHQIGENGLTFQLVTLFRTGLPWRYEGPVHEILLCDAPAAWTPLPGPLVRGHFDSARNAVDHQTKYRADAAVLKATLDREPDHPRHSFYLAQSHRDAGDIDEAIAAYERRAELVGWDEETWVALLEAGRLRMHRGDTVAEITAALLRAYEFRPSRAEPLVLLATMFRRLDCHALAYLYASQAAALPKPPDRLFLNESDYLWRARDELAVAASWTGRYGEALRLCDGLLAEPALPSSERGRIAANRAMFARRCGIVLDETATDAGPGTLPDPTPARPAEPARPMRVAVVTPYHKEPDALLSQAHRSVLAQTHPCTHILLADGHPNPRVSDWDAEHVILPRGHADNGNTPRFIGALSAFNRGCDAVAFLDADNWYEPDHIERMVALHRRTGADVCSAGRTIVRLDGTLMFEDDECNGVDFVDTSCLFLTGRAVHFLPLWGMMPPGAGPIGDRVFWQAVVNQGLRRAHDPAATVAFRSQYACHYERIGETPPPDAKSIAMVEDCLAWFSRSAEAHARCLPYLYPSL